MDETLDVLCLSSDPAPSRQVAGLLAGLPGFNISVRELDYAAGLRDLRDPDLAVVVLGADPKLGLGVIEEVHRAAPSTQVVALAPQENPDTIIRAMRAGADEFLPLPVDQNGLLKVCLKVSAIRKSSQPNVGRRGEVWVTHGAKGGIGVTTLAANLAFALRAAQKNTALVDLDIYSGDLALFLNVTPGYTLRDIASNFKRLDSVFLQGTMIRHSSGLELLAAPAPAAGDAPLLLSGEQTLGILQLLDATHDVTLVDTPSVPTDASRAALGCADRILLVTELTLPALRATLRTFEWLREDGIDADTIEVIVNKHANRSWEVAPAEAARTLRRPIRALLPRDDAAVCTAVNGGVPLANGPLQKAIANLADTSNAVQETGAVLKGIRRLFSGAERRA